MSTAYDPTQYRVLIETHAVRVSGGPVPEMRVRVFAYCPQLGTHAERFFENVRNAQDLGSLVLEVWEKNRAVLAKIAQSGAEIPIPRSAHEVLSDTSTRLIGIKEAAQLLKVSQDTVRILADQKKIPCVKTEGGHRRFTEKDLLTYGASRGLMPL